MPIDNCRLTSDNIKEVVTLKDSDYKEHGLKKVHVLVNFEKDPRQLRFDDFKDFPPEMNESYLLFTFSSKLND